MNGSLNHSVKDCNWSAANLGFSLLIGLASVAGIWLATGILISIFL